MLSFHSPRTTAVLCISLTALILTGLMISQVIAAPGDLDLSFGTIGYVITDINNGNEQANAVAVQADGMIIAAGYTGSAGQDFALLRYTDTGSPDTSFGTNGQVITPIGAGNSTINAIALQPDGNIVVAGTSTNGTKTIFTVARYISTTGALDSSFGTGGVVTTSLSTGNDTANAIALQSDGKIVVAGNAGDVNAKFAVTRYTITGTLDTSFHGTGIVTTTVGAFDIAHAVAIQPGDGKIVVAGESDQGGVNAFAVARYNTNGSLDTTFHTNGIATSSFGNLNTFALATALQPDGKIVLAGYTSSGATDFALARYTSNGNLDTTFSATGMISTTFGAGADEAHALVIQPTGKIVAVGFSNQGATHKNDFAVARYLSNGTLDATFGTGGQVLTDLQTNADDLAYAAALDASNRIVVAGTSDNGTATNFDIAVARYLSPSQPPTVSDFTKNGFENSTVTFTATDFITHFNSLDGNVMSKIQITSLPVSGTLNLSTTAVVLNQEIPIAQLGNLTYVPDPYFFGTDAFNWNGFDGVNYATVGATVTLNIAFVNQPPSFTKGPDVAVFENSDLYTATNWATNVMPGPANEASQVLTFTLTTNNPSLFAVQPAISISGTDGTLIFMPAASQYGTATVTATLKDSGGTANGGVDTSIPQTFTIAIKQYQVFLPQVQR